MRKKNEVLQKYHRPIEIRTLHRFTNTHSSELSIQGFNIPISYSCSIPS